MRKEAPDPDVVEDTWMPFFSFFWHTCGKCNDKFKMTIGYREKHRLPFAAPIYIYRCFGCLDKTVGTVIKGE